LVHRSRFSSIHNSLCISTINFNSLTDPSVANLPFDANGQVIASRATPRGAGFGVANTYQAARSIQAQVRFSFGGGETPRRERR
jgi:hypothetical protein